MDLVFQGVVTGVSWVKFYNVERSADVGNRSALCAEWWMVAFVFWA